MEESSETSIVKTVESESLNAIKSKFNIKQIFSFLNEYRKFETIKYNKKYQNLFTLNIESYKKKSCRYKIGGINGPGKEFSLDNDSLVFEGEYLNKKRNGKGKEYGKWGNELIFEGEYLNGKRNGKGKEYYQNKLLIEGEYLKGERSQDKNQNTKSYFYGELKFEGQYKNGKRNGKGKEYYKYGEIKFEGEYLNGNRWNGKGYDPKNNVSYELKNGEGSIKEYYDDGELKFEGEYLNGQNNGKGKEYLYSYGPLELDYKPNYSNGPSGSDDKYVYTGFFWIKTFNSFEGEYKNGKRNGNGKEFYSDGKIKFEGEYFDGKRWKGKGYDPLGNLEYGMKDGLGYIKEYFSNGKLKFEAQYIKGEKHGFTKEYNIEYNEMKFWQCETIENREFYYLKFEGQYINGKRNGKGKVKNINNGSEFEGEYLNGKKHGKGKEYNYENKLKFKGEFLNGKKWNGIVFHYHCNGGLDYVVEYIKGEKGKMTKCDGEKKFEYEQEILNDEKLQKEEKEKQVSKEDKNRIQNYITKYGKEVGLPNLQLNDKNFCSLNFDGKIYVDIIYNDKENLCSFASPICSIPNNDKEKFYKKLLISNSFGIENGGAVISIDNQKNQIMLSFTFIANTFSYELFKTVLLNFVTVAEKNMDKYEHL